LNPHISELLGYWTLGLLNLCIYHLTLRLLTYNHLARVFCCAQKADMERLERVNADLCLQIQELEHCISARDTPSSQLDNT